MSATLHPADTNASLRSCTVTLPSVFGRFPMKTFRFSGSTGGSPPLPPPPEDAKEDAP